MRPIKFRAWDKINKIMLSPEDIELSWLPDGSLLVNGDDRVGEDKEDLFTIMQFTGLLDSKGKEVYEGDILSWYGFGGMVDKPNLRVMTWEKGGFKPTSTFLNENTLVYEVIGNIYENRDLLR